MENWEKEEEVLEKKMRKEVGKTHSGFKKRSTAQELQLQPLLSKLMTGFSL